MVGFSEAQIMAWLSPILWPFIRILAIFTAAPVLSSRSVPMRVKVGLAFLVAVSVQAALPNMPVISPNSPELFGVVLQQVGVGLAIGFAVRLVFSAFEFAGELIGTLMGLNFASFFDPTLNNPIDCDLTFLHLHGVIVVCGAKWAHDAHDGGGAQF